MAADAQRVERLLVTGSERQGCVEVETDFYQVIDGMPVEIVVRSRLPARPDRTIQELRAAVRDQAIAALQAHGTTQS